MYVENQPPRGLRIDGPGDDRFGHRADRSLEGVRRLEAKAGAGEQLAALLLAPPFGIQLRGVAVADGFSLHGRGFALLAVPADVPAATVVGVAGFERGGFVLFFFAYPHSPTPD